MKGHAFMCGGRFADWCVGAARERHTPILEAYEREEQEEAFLCRKACAAASARAVRLHFVSDCGTARTPSGPSDDGKLVFAFKKSALPSRVFPSIM